MAKTFDDVIDALDRMTKAVDAQTAATQASTKAYVQSGMGGRPGGPGRGAGTGGYGPGGGIPRGGMPGRGGLPGMPRLGGFGPMIAGAGVEHALQVGARASTLFRDPYRTNGQSAGQLALETVPGLKNLADIAGRQSRIDQTNVNIQKTALISSGAIERRQSAYQLGMQSDAARTRSDVLGGASATAFSGGDRSSAVGEQQYQFARRLLPLQTQSAKAEREQTIAVKDREKAQSRLLKLEREAVALERKRSDFQKALDDDKGKGWFNGAVDYIAGSDKRAAYSTGVVEMERQLEANNRMREGATRGIADARIKEAEAGSAARSANIGIQKEQLAQTSEMLGESKNTARRLGSMGVGERMAAKQAYDLVKQIGVDAAGPGMVAMARQYAPDDVDKLTELAGASSGEYRAGQAAGMRGFGDIGKLERAEVAQINAIQKADLANEQQTAKQVDSALSSGLAESIDKLIAERVDAAIRSIDSKLIQQRSRE